MKTRRAVLAHGLALMCLLGGGAAWGASGNEGGSDSATPSLEAPGPYAVTSVTLPKTSSHAAVRVYYPSESLSKPFGLFVFCPGFLGPSWAYAGIGNRIASHGFVVAEMDTQLLTNGSPARGAQMIAVRQDVVAQASTAGSALFGKLDPQRVAFGGHSAGGAGTFHAAITQTDLKALIGLMPGEPSRNYAQFSGIRVPTLLLTGQNDSLASSWADGYQSQLGGQYTAVRIELAGASHLAPLTYFASQASQARVAKYMAAWLARYLNDDLRYEGLYTAKQADMSGFKVIGAP
jgi:dienelactone hydrolase